MKNFIDMFEFFLICSLSLSLSLSQNNIINIFKYLRSTIIAGGLVCRGLLSTLQDHNVDTFIALSSPLAGLYGGIEYACTSVKKYSTHVHNL